MRHDTKKSKKKTFKEYVDMAGQEQGRVKGSWHLPLGLIGKYEPTLD